MTSVWKNGVGKRCDCPNRPRCDCHYWIRAKYKTDKKSGIGPVTKFAFLLEKHQPIPTTREGAEHLANRVRDWLVRGKPMPESAVKPVVVERTGHDLIDGWLTWRAPKMRMKSQHVQDIEASLVKRAREAFGALSMSELVKADCFSAFVTQQLAAGRKIATANRTLAGVMRPAIRWGLAQEPPWLTKNPFGEHRFQIDRSKEVRRTQRCTPEQEARILAACTKLGPTYEVLADFVVLSIDLGTRTGELHLLTNGDVDWHSHTVTLRETKRGETRIVPFNAKGRVGKILARRRFAGPTALVTRSYKMFRLWVHAVCIGWDLPFAYTRTCYFTAETTAAYKSINLRLHDLRHEASTWWGICGVSDEDREFLQGHTSQWMQSRYSHEKLARAKTALAGKVWPRERERAQFPKRAKAQGA